MGGRQLVAALFGLALLVGLLFLFTRGERPSGPAAPRTAEAPDERDPASLEDVDVPAPEEPATAVTAPRAALAAETEEEPTPNDVFVLVGLVVDEADLPLPGVTVQLGCFGTWAEGHDVAYLPDSDLYRGWETSTDAEGNFRFQGPPFGPPVRLLHPTPMQSDLFGIDCAIAELTGDATPDLVFSALPESQPLALFLWNGAQLAPPLQLLAPRGAGDHFANSLVAGQFIPGGHEELAIGDPTYDPAGGPPNAGRVAVLVGIP